jgi:hypothetical protein
MLTRMRHLTPSFAESALRRGAPIEILLTPGECGAARWLSARASDGTFRLHLYELEEAVPDDFYDLSALISDEADESSEVGRYADAADLFVAASELGGEPDAWVNHGLIGAEYWDSRAT